LFVTRTERWISKLPNGKVEDENRDDEGWVSVDEQGKRERKEKVDRRGIRASRK
jgi:hypothetical protein